MNTDELRDISGAVASLSFAVVYTVFFRVRRVWRRVAKADDDRLIKLELRVINMDYRLGILEDRVRELEERDPNFVPII